MLRDPPDYLIIGAKRAGTTSLYNYLLANPSVAPLFPAVQGIKGVHYFDRQADRSFSWYRSHFPVRTNRGHRLCGESSPYYLYHPLAARRVAAALPSVKLIVLLRDPAERAWSHYKDEVRNGRETLSFRDAVAAERERTDVELQRLLADEHYRSEHYEHLTYVSQGLYAHHLARWLDRFRPDRLCVLRSESMFADPEATYARVLDFLGLVRRTAVSFDRFNATEPDPDDTGAVDELRRYYEPHNRRLTDLVGWEPAWGT
jgi:hypothetical protein